MDASTKSKGEQVIEGIMKELDPGSERYGVLSSAKRFKSSWVELGEKLLEVQRRGLFREWGYDSFEDYCAREIRIKKPTAQKLTHAYRYLEKEEPELLARQTELKPLPDYRSVDLLRQAREDQDFSEEEYGELRRAVMEEERSHPTVLKRFREVAASREEETETTARHLRSALAAARRLGSALQPLPEPAVSFLSPLEELIATLEGLAEEMPGPGD